MWKNNVKIIFRSLGKQKLFTGLNMLGLALGLTIASLLLLYINNELSFDRQHQNFQNIYRVLVHVSDDESGEVLATAPNVVGPSAVENIPGIVAQTRWLKHNFGEKAFVNTNDKKLVERQLYWTDPGLFKIFDLKILAGDPSQFLTEPNQIVLSRSSAQKYFGDLSPLGQTLTIDHKHKLEVVGVYENFPINSSLDAEMIGSISSLKWTQRLVWSNSSFETYLLLNQQKDPGEVEDDLAQLLDQNVEKEEQWFELSLQALGDMHLQSKAISNAYTSRLGDPQQVKILAYLALLVLLIACINYMNMSTARSQKRFREVGINKTIGASKGQLIKRFYAETAILVFLSMFLALAFIQFSFPLFNQLADQQFKLTDLLSPVFLTGMVTIVLLIILISGSYPAFYLSSFSPKDLFHTSYQRGTGAGMLRKVLVSTQFLASLIIIVTTITFYRQLNFIQNKNLGYQPDLVLGVSTAGAENNAQIEGYINRLQALPEVMAAGRAQTFPGRDASGRRINKPQNSEQSLNIQTNRVSPAIIDILDLNLIAGTTLPNRSVSYEDSIVQVILNESAVQFLGYSPEEAIGKLAPGLFYRKRTEIVGVVKDFHFENFYKSIAAYAFHNNPSEWRNYTLVKLDTKDLAASMKNVKSIFQATIPNSAFEFVFLDQQLEQLYRSEQRTANIFLVFSLITIFIACMGLFGLASYTAEQRTKEIGIRKVLGASVAGIVGLLSKDFLKLVLIGVILAIPASVYLMDLWLQNFVYRIELPWWVFAASGTTVLVIAFLTISFQSIKTASSNPLHSLRRE